MIKKGKREGEDKAKKRPLHLTETASYEVMKNNLIAP